MGTRRILFLPRRSLARDILSDRARSILEGLGNVVWNHTDRDFTAQELASLLPGTEAVVTSWGAPAFSPELLAFADRLRIVGHAAGSVKHLMPKEGYDRGIVVLSAARVIADAVAEYTLWAMLTMQRELCLYEPLMREKRGWKTAAEGFGHELYYKRIGVVGVSLVGRKVIELLRPFACEVVVYDPYLNETECRELGVRCIALEELFATSDIVSLHAPTTAETERMIDARHFQVMKDRALFINTARAWIVDQAAMLATLRSGRIRAVLDVFDCEPLPVDDELRDLDNVLLTPHIAGHSMESRRRLVEAIATDMQRFFAGQTLRLAVVWDRLRIMA